MYSGTFTALVTPFKDGEVDYDALDRLIERQIEAGVDGVVPAGCENGAQGKHKVVELRQSGAQPHGGDLQAHQVIGDASGGVAVW